MRRLVCLLMVGLVTWTTACGLPVFSISNIGLEQGLSNGYVRDLAIDDNGFVWVATENGLNRISGSRCTPMLWNPKIFNGRTLTCLHYENTEKKLWIGSHRGVAVYEGTTQEFRKLGQADGIIGRDVANISEASDRGLWITFTNGIIQHYDVRRKTFTNYDYRKLTGKKSPLFSCTDDGNGHLYICTNGDGLVVLNLNTKRLTAYTHQEGNSQSIPGNQPRQLFIDHLKNIWVATKNGLSLFNQATGRFTNFHHVAGDERSLCGENIFSISEFDNRYLWIAADLGGISVLDLEDMKPAEAHKLTFENLTDDNSDLSSSCIRVVKQDSFGNIWVGIADSGVDFISASPTAFRVFPYMKERQMSQELKRVYGIKADRNGHIWMGGESEIAEFYEGRLLHSWKTNQYLSVINAVETDHRGMVWMGMNDVGIVYLDPRTGQFHKVGDGFEKNDIHVLHEDSHQKMWIGFDAGLYSYENGEVHEETVYNKQMDTRSVFSLIFDRDGQLWVGTGERGIYVFDRQKKLVAHLLQSGGFPSNSIYHLYEAHDGSIWAATSSGLVHIPDNSHPAGFVVYDEKQGLRDKSVRAIQQDRNGNIWISTYTHIACLNISKNRFYNYDYHNNIPRGSFVEGGTLMTADGTIYFSSPQGVCYFNPLDINERQAVSPVHIVSINGLASSQESDSVVFFKPDQKGTVHLKHHENHFVVVFSVADYSQLGDVEYMYQMQGLDDKWYDTNGSDEVTFRNLPVGKYVFTVRAKLKNQDWEDASETQMTIVIHPPFWLTWWAKLFYALLLACAVWGYVRSYKRKLQFKSAVELERRDYVQKQELNEERLRFFTNITHELRTPLTLIIGPLEDLARDSRLPAVLQRKVDGIRSGAERLLSLVNDLLEFRKAETQNRHLTVAKGDVGALVREIGVRYQDLNRNPKVAIEVVVSDGLQPVYFDSEVINTIVNNLMSNAIKYTPEGQVRLAVGQLTDGDVEISVTDTGYGIEPEALAKIFDRYYQAKGKHQASGTGIGLALVKSLAQLHEAEIKVDSKVGVGSRFALVLKGDKTYPDALHKEDAIDVTPYDETAADRVTPDDDERPLLLVVEDNADIRQYVQESLGEYYRIIQAADGLEGISAALEQIPDLIVSDIMMPVIDGISLVKRLKEDVRTSHIPIILLTAKTSANDQEEGYDSGADSYLTKPFTARLLNSRIRNLLASRRKLAELVAMRYSSARVEQSQLEASADGPVLSPIDQDFLDRFNQLIDDHLDKEDLDMVFLTDKMAMSHSTLYRKVKALTGMTVNEYVRKQKLHRTMALLRSGKYNVTEAAMMAGFNNMGHFRDSFKKEFGITPSEVLKNR